MADSVWTHHETAVRPPEAVDTVPQVASDVLARLLKNRDPAIHLHAIRLDEHIAALLARTAPIRAERARWLHPPLPR